MQEGISIGTAGECTNCGIPTIRLVLANCGHSAHACSACFDRHQSGGPYIENCADCIVPDGVDDDEHPLSLALTSEQYYQLTTHIREMSEAYGMTETDLVRFIIESHYEKFVTPPSKAHVGNIYKKWLKAWDTSFSPAPAPMNPTTSYGRTYEEAEVLQWVHGTLSNCCGLLFTGDQAREIMADATVSKCFNIGGLDTSTRESAMNFLALKILGRRWPVCGDGKIAMEDFNEEFIRTAPAKGYDVFQ